jgi:hypothetical protein
MFRRPSIYNPFFLSAPTMIGERVADLVRETLRLAA